MQTPSVGRIVHYVERSLPRPHLAAIITEVTNNKLATVCLTVFPPLRSSVPFYTVPYDARMSPGTWHYPEIVNTVSYHESENEAEKREGPVSNSADIDGR